MDAPRSRRSVLRLGVGAVLGTFALPAAVRAAIVQAAASPSPPGATMARLVSHGDRARRVIALTVDDGWNAERVRTIFGILESMRVAATFMPYARAMRADPALWRQIAAAGYPVGNHTTTHPDLTRLSSAKQVAEIAGGRAIAEDIIGRATVRVFRPPYGAYNQSVLGAAVEAGFPTVVLWDTSDRDTSPTGTAQHMLDAAETGTNGSILLTHGGPAMTPTILPAIIAYYRARGFRFVTLPELLGLAGPAPTFAATSTPHPTAPAPASPTPSVPARAAQGGQPINTPAPAVVFPGPPAPAEPSTGSLTAGQTENHQGTDPALEVAAILGAVGIAATTAAVIRRRTSAGRPGGA